MQCRDVENCSARKYPDIPCWELAEKPKNSHCAMNICYDCLVYVVKTDNSILSDQEVADILESRNISISGKAPARQSGTEKKKTGKEKGANPDTRKN